MKRKKGDDDMMVQLERLEPTTGTMRTVAVCKGTHGSISKMVKKLEEQNGVAAADLWITGGPLGLTIHPVRKVLEVLPREGSGSA